MPPAPSSTPPTWLWNTSQRSSAGSSPWHEALNPDALCFHLNFHGEGLLTLANGRGMSIKPQSLVCCRGAKTAARTLTRDRHECLTLVYPDAWLTEYLREVMGQVPDAVRRLVTSPFPTLGVQVRALSPEDLIWARSLMMSCISDAVRRMLDTARLADFLLRVLFSSGESLNESPALLSRSQRASHDRIERVKNQILRHLDENHDLESLAAEAGCSPHYLSRTFAQVNGIPLMLWIRRTRIERAAELIASGRCNVSEAALEVGYSSFSHFSRAFQEEKGVSPSKWISHLTNTRTH
ncbi:AraC family transcriptional regulator [Prosthecobacter sp. SYSU 5D2]|uniref:helix-turn-helix transcriptional regulator n=1 Tax=Prosthecobacter sp. SYSU 5D2 TaxID=3134134 RepID=UPI0031FF454F